MTEAVDRIHEYAFREDPDGDPGILDRGLALAQLYYAHLAETAAGDARPRSGMICRS